MPSDSRTCFQVNYQTSFGGGEVYTRFVCAALARLGWRSVLFVHRDARFWGALDMHGAELVPIATVAEIEARLPGREALLIAHNVLDAETAARWSARHRFGGFAHMPLYDRAAPGLARYRKVFAVSQHVLDSAVGRGLANCHPEPLLGVADLSARGVAREPRRGVLYDWDPRKPRDRLLGWIAPMLGAFRPEVAFKRSPGVTLGIVSRITPIKQFPRMFSILAPVIASFPALRLEIFGSGGYASVRDLRRALAPARGQARFWGHQADVARVYPQLDYVLSGLPEKEALGLNLIEAQAAGTPVLAVNAPPFTETVLDGASGFLYRDPREDGGAGFRALIERIVRGAARPDPRLAAEHLARFSPERFAERLARAIAAIPAAP